MNGFTMGNTFFALKRYNKSLAAMAVHGISSESEPVGNTVKAVVKP